MTNQPPCLPCVARTDAARADAPRADTPCPDPGKQPGVLQSDVDPHARPVLTDAVAHRPILGGHRIQYHTFDPGTLGFFLWERDNHDAGYIATAQHLFGQANPPGLPALAAVGQPSGKGTTCAGTCSGDIVGQWIGGRYDPKGSLFDLALIRLTPGTTWKAEIAGIGPVRGPHDVTQAEMTSGTYGVMKRGHLSGLTGGIIDKDHSIMSKTTPQYATFRIIPNQPRNRPAGSGFTYFDLEGDSGSALINNQCQVIGMVVGRDPNGVGVAYSIGVVMKHVADITGPLKLNLELAFVAAGQDSPVHTVPTPAKVLEPVS